MAAELLLHSQVFNHCIPDVLVTESGRCPAWLLSSYQAPEWKVTNIGDKNPKVLVFDATLQGGKKLSSYPNLYESIKRIAYGLRTGPIAEIESADVQQTVVNNLITLARWMISRDILRFSQLTTTDREEYAAAAVYGVHNILNTESLLERHLEGILGRADFQPEDEKIIRRNKARLAFPTRGEGSRTVLDRARLLMNAGADQNLIGRKGNVLTSLLDEAEALCGFNQSKTIKARAGKSRDDYDEDPVSEEHLRRFLMSFEYLYRHRRYLDDAIHSNPFPFTSPRAEARKLGSEVGRTGTVPAKQAIHLVERSVRWVLDYAPTILDIKTRAEQTYKDDPKIAADKYAAYLTSVEKWPRGPASPFPLRAARRYFEDNQGDEPIAELSSDGMSLHLAILSLMTACAVVIAAFSARRASEICGLKAGCIHIDDSGGIWMRCFIHKTLKTESLIPVPEVVAAAVKVLENLSERSRHLTGTEYIFLYNIPGKQETYGISEAGLPNFPLVKHLRKFGYFVDVPLLEDRTRWTFKPHQFRRFFAILYIWVYDKGNWGALQYHLRHFTSEMTRRYVTENELGQIIAQVNKEHTATILSNAALGLSQIGGTEGMKLKNVAQRLHSHLTKHTDVVSERKYKQRLEKLVERTGLELVAFPWGYCVKRKHQEVANRNCTNSAEPDYTQASEITCTGCVHNMVTTSASSFLMTVIQFHRNVIDSPHSPDILRKASQTIHNNLSGALVEITQL
jgi:integrase